MSNFVWRSVHKWPSYARLTDFKMAAAAILDFFAMCVNDDGTRFQPLYQTYAIVGQWPRLWPTIWISIWRTPPYWISILSDISISSSKYEPESKTWMHGKVQLTDGRPLGGSVLFFAVCGQNLKSTPAYVTMWWIDIAVCCFLQRLFPIDNIL